ncbi:MAG: toll/interleukin-1 receptor domain-containing protein [Pseudomonadota bacterium]
MSESKNQSFFISHSSKDITFAREVDQILTEAGYKTTRQEKDFGHKNFIAAIDDALAAETGARVISLYSEDYFLSDYCRAEAYAAISGDILNKKQRLIPMRVRECKPTALYQAKNRLEEAEPLMTRALAIFKQSLPEGHPNILTLRQNVEFLMQDIEG